MVQFKDQRFVATQLDATGRRARRIQLSDRTPAIIALRPGVAQALAADVARSGTVRVTPFHIPSRGAVLKEEHLPPDPRRADIRFVPKLIAGGRGLGGPEGFQTLRRIADKLGAGVAASRMAVDLGWIEQERQVGQTGKTVRPELYIACGISGASHHLDGMSESRHIVAINSDPQAPLMQRAELAIQADLHDVLKEFGQLLERTT